MHVATFAPKAGLTSDELASLLHGDARDACWSGPDGLLIRLCDSLHRDCTVEDDLWDALSSAFSAEALLELIMLAGTYHTVSYLVNTLRLPPEPGASRFADIEALQSISGRWPDGQ